VLDPFPTVLEPRYHRPGVGTPLSFRCNPPSSYPQGAVYWGENRSGPKLRPIETTERIVADYEGISLSQAYWSRYNSAFPGNNCVCMRE